MNCNKVQDLKQQKSGKWNHNVGGESSSTTNFRSNMSYVVKLAPESPCNINNKSYDLVSHDESSYDSFHNYETDVCKDSTDDDFSDTDSSKTEGYAVLDVEYEVASSTADDDDASFISSGTDEFTYKAATAAYYQFKLMNDHHGLSDDSTDDFILADTEDDTDGSIDLELGQADYWKCIKCNNKQNNPLYRYCEKCYQVRKSLFPPRPRRHKKTRSDVNRKRKMAQPTQDYSTSEIESDSDFDSPAKKKFVCDNLTSTSVVATSSSLSTSSSAATTASTSCLIKNGNQFLKIEKHENSKHANSAGELSCNNSSSDENDDGETSHPQLLSNCSNSGGIVKKIKVSPSASIEIAKCYPSSSIKSSLGVKLENKLISKVLLPKYLDLKDSGLSSCQESSQECLSSPLDEGTSYLTRTISSISSQSLESNSDCHTQSTQLLQDSNEETDSEEILSRADQFTKKCQGPVETFKDDIYDSNLGICRFCMVNPKNGIFIHSNCSHICCCYQCALKVWKKRKSCPVCNCKVKNVLKVFAN